MGIIHKQVYAYYPLDAFSDPTAGEELRARRRELDTAMTADPPTTPEVVKQWLEQAKANRAKQERKAWLESASRLLLLAQHDTGTLPKESGAAPRADTSAERFHFAANELRRADLLERSAQAYFNAAVRALEATDKATSLVDGVNETLELGVRSAGRAQSMFDGLGEDEKADSAHALRMDLVRHWKRLQKARLSYWLLLLWGGLTRYGTSSARWLGTLLVALVVMSLMYALLSSPTKPAPAHLVPALLLHNQLGMNSVITAPYLAVVNLFAFGGYTNVTPQNWLGQLAVLSQTIVSFFWLGTGVTFLTRR
jgi:hypothetical protein